MYPSNFRLSDDLFINWHNKIISRFLFILQCLTTGQNGVVGNFINLSKNGLFLQDEIQFSCTRVTIMYNDVSPENSSGRTIMMGDVKKFSFYTPCRSIIEVCVKAFGSSLEKQSQNWIYLIDWMVFDGHSFVFVKYLGNNLMVLFQLEFQSM